MQVPDASNVTIPIVMLQIEGVVVAIETTSPALVLAETANGAEFRGFVEIGSKSMTCAIFLIANVLVICGAAAHIASPG